MPNKVDKAVIVILIAGGVIFMAGTVIYFAGFTGPAVLAGSIAAGLQALIGNVVAGSAFSIFQSLAATRMVATVGLTGVVVLLGGLGYWGGKTYPSTIRPKL